MAVSWWFVPIRYTVRAQWARGARAVHVLPHRPCIRNESPRSPPPGVSETVFPNLLSLCFSLT